MPDEGAWPAVPCGGQPGSYSGQSGDGTGGTGYTYGWEIAYNEFVNRLGLPMPNTQGDDCALPSYWWRERDSLGDARQRRTGRTEWLHGARPSVGRRHPLHSCRRRRELSAVGAHQARVG